MAKCLGNTKVVRTVVLASLALCLGGCGPAGTPMVPVSGTVNVRGKPLAAGRIFFEPVAGISDAQSAVGEVADGGFSLHTQTPGDGVHIGKYYPVVLDPKNDQRDAKHRIGVVQLETTVLEVTEAGPNVFEIEVTAEDLRYSVTDN